MNSWMNVNVVNKELKVGHIDIIGISSSSVFLVGDTEVVTCSSAFDTPPESLIIGPLATTAPENR
jgi:spore germination protein PD